MLRNFTGSHDHRMDDKGRVSLPTEFRRVLDALEMAGSLYVVPELSEPGSIAFLTMQGYDELIARHNRTDYPSGAHRRRAEITLIAHATQVQVDDVGRIVVTRVLRERFGLGKAVRFVGGGSHFELWSPEVRDAYEEEQLSEPPDDSFEINIRGLHG